MNDGGIFNRYFASNLLLTDVHCACDCERTLTTIPRSSQRRPWIFMSLLMLTYHWRWHPRVYGRHVRRRVVTQSL